MPQELALSFDWEKYVRDTVEKEEELLGSNLVGVEESWMSVVCVTKLVLVFYSSS